MNVTVRLFAGLRRAAGVDELSLELSDGACVGDLMAVVGERVEPVRRLNCVVAVNHDYAPPMRTLHEADEIALIPPVSGGSPRVRHVEVTDAALDQGAIARAVGDPAAGAVVVFQGVTREVPALDYEAYTAMATRRMTDIAEAEAARHGLLAVAVVHRVGRVALGEPSVLVAVSAAHRDAAFAGARAVIDRLKAESPIWKREIDPDGAVRAVHGTVPPVARAGDGGVRERAEID